MAEEKFTKGPWTVEHSDLSYPFSGSVFWVTAKDAVDGIWNDAGECSEANARLIAAAPDLYEALKSLTEACGDVRPFRGEIIDPSKDKVLDSKRAINFIAAVDAARAALDRASPQDGEGGRDNG